MYRYDKIVTIISCNFYKLEKKMKKKHPADLAIETR